MSGEVDKKKFFEDIKNSHWTSDAVKTELEKIIAKKSSNVLREHEFRWDSEDSCNYVYDNDCYIFVHDRKIVVRCDRENIFSSDLEIDIPIASERDIEQAYERFVSMTMETEEDEDE